MRLLLVIGLLSCFAAGTAWAETAVPPLVNYQGLLTDTNGASIPDGVKKLEFNLYDAPLAGNRVWGPQVFDNVPVVNGRFNVILGTTDAAGRPVSGAFATSQRYLGFKVGSAGANLSGVAEISPRQQILSAPFSMQSEHAARSDSAARADRVDGLFVNPADGNVGIGTTGPVQKLTVNGVIRSLSGGFQFPDGTAQATVARLKCVTISQNGQYANCPAGYIATGCSAGMNRGSMDISDAGCHTQSSVDWTLARCCKVE